MSVKKITTEYEIALAFREPRIHEILTKQHEFSQREVEGRHMSPTCVITVRLPSK